MRSSFLYYSLCPATPFCAYASGEAWQESAVAYSRAAGRRLPWRDLAVVYS